MKKCKELESHQKEKNGATDIEWLRQHVKKCEVCKAIMAGVNLAVNDAFVMVNEE